MTTYLIYIFVRYLVVSSLLYVVWHTLLRGRASYLGQRLFLLALPLVALGIAMLDSDTIKIRVNQTQQIAHALTTISEASQDLIFEMPSDALDAENIEYSAPIATGAEVASTPVTAHQQAPKVVVDAPVKRAFDWGWLIFSLWGVGALYTLARYAVGLYQIYRIRRSAIQDVVGGIHIYRSPYIDGSFSFQRSIYINSSLNGERYDVVLLHERAHIENLHFIDKFILEFYSVLMWFNPVLYPMHRSIALLHEFEADGAVIGAGCDVVQYKHFIYDEMVGVTPLVANGLNNSQLKQRFLQMKKSYQLRSNWTTRIGSLLAVALLVVVASCTFVQAEPVHKIAPSTFNPEIGEGKITIYLKDGTQRDGVAGEMADWILENAALVDSINIVKAKSEDIVDKDYRPEPKFCMLDQEQYHLIDRKDFAPTTIYRRDGYTEVDAMYEIYSNWYWTYFTSNDYLLDRKTGKRYNVIGMAGGKPLNQRLVIREHKDEFALHTLIFEPIDEGVEYVDYVSGDLPDSLRRPSDVMEDAYSADIKVHGNIERPYRDSRNGAKIKVDIDGLKIK